MLGSYYEDNLTVKLTDCYLESLHTSEKYTFQTTSNQGRRGSILLLEDCHLHWENQRSDGAWWHLDADYAHVRLVNPTFSGNGTTKQIIARGQYSTFETEKLPPGFDLDEDFIDQSGGTNRLHYTGP